MLISFILLAQHNGTHSCYKPPAGSGWPLLCATLRAFTHLILQMAYITPVYYTYILHLYIKPIYYTYITPILHLYITPIYYTYILHLYYTYITPILHLYYTYITPIYYTYILHLYYTYIILILVILFQCQVKTYFFNLIYLLCLYIILIIFQCKLLIIATAVHDSGRGGTQTTLWRNREDVGLRPSHTCDTRRRHASLVLREDVVVGRLGRWKWRPWQISQHQQINCRECVTS